MPPRVLASEPKPSGGHHFLPSAIFLSRAWFQLHMSRQNIICSKTRLNGTTHEHALFVGSILVPRGCAPFGQRQESPPLAQSNDIPFLNGFVNTID